MQARRPSGGLYYNTNGFPFHHLEDAVRIMADLGYAGVALTPDVHHLDPLRTGPEEWRAFSDLLDALGLGVVIETGARFVLDPRRKHGPTLLDEEDEALVRLGFLQRCVDMAVVLGAPVVTCWSGAAPAGLPQPTAWQRLVSGLQSLCRYAGERRVRIGFEPEPGMLMERASDWPRLRDDVAHPALGLTLDVGHCLAMREPPPEEAIAAHAADLLVIQLDDHRVGVHDHLMFGEGEVDFARIAATVKSVGFAGPLEVELSRHGSTAPATAEASYAFLDSYFD
jgi:sugar phosphate isomerase/epimerase